MTLFDAGHFHGNIALSWLRCQAQEKEASCEHRVETWNQWHRCWRLDGERVGVTHTLSMQSKASRLECTRAAGVLSSEWWTTPATTVVFWMLVHGWCYECVFCHFTNDLLRFLCVTFHSLSRSRVVFWGFGAWKPVQCPRKCLACRCIASCLSSICSSVLTVESRHSFDSS